MLELGTTVILDGAHKGRILSRGPFGYLVQTDYGAEEEAYWDGESVSALTGEPLLAAVECV
jgi:hypothetical protein